MVIWITIMILILILADAALLEPNLFMIKKYQIPLEVKQNIRIIHISDTHFHKHFIKSRLLRLIIKINRYQPDFIIFTGDLMDHYEKSKRLRYELPPYLKALRAKVAKIAIYGNHDIGGGAKYVYADIMKEGGFHVLCNESIVYPQYGLAFFGIDDALAGYEDITVTQARLQPIQILLAHEPDLIDRLEMQHITLMMSGHTHGGQICLPFLTQMRLPKGGKHYRKGIYRIKNTILSVNSGIGTTLLPLRFACPSQIILYDFIVPTNQ